MTYAIANVVVGATMPNSLKRFIDEINHEYEDLDWHTFYEGSAYCGVVIDEFDETENFTAGKLIAKLTPTAEQLEQGQIAINNMREKVIQFLNTYPTPPHPDDDDPLTPDEIKKIVDSLPTSAECLVIWSSS